MTAFRECPGNASGAARLAGVDVSTARRAWTHGWPSFGPPIRDLLADEQRRARELAAAKLRAEHEQARAASIVASDAHVEALAAEEKLRAVGRSAVVEMARAVLERRALLGALLDRLDAEAPKMKTRDVVGAIREVRTLLAELPALAKTVTESGIAAREERGGVRPGDDALVVQAERPISDAEVDEELEQAAELYARIHGVPPPKYEAEDAAARAKLGLPPPAPEVDDESADPNAPRLIRHLPITPGYERIARTMAARCGLLVIEPEDDEPEDESAAAAIAAALVPRARDDEPEDDEHDEHEHEERDGSEPEPEKPARLDVDALVERAVTSALKSFKIH